jgi:hypothetical protein
LHDRERSILMTETPEAPPDDAEYEILPEGDAASPETPEEPPTPTVHPPQDLQFERLPRESDAEFLARTRGQVVDSRNPADIVPNQPQIYIGPQNPVPEPEPSPDQQEQP